MRPPKFKKPDYLIRQPGFPNQPEIQLYEIQQFTNFGTVVFRPPITRSLAFRKSAMRKPSKQISGRMSTGKCGAVGQFAYCSKAEISIYHGWAGRSAAEIPICRG